MALQSESIKERTSVPEGHWTQIEVKKEDPLVVKEISQNEKDIADYYTLSGGISSLTPCLEECEQPILICKDKSVEAFKDNKSVVKQFDKFDEYCIVIKNQVTFLGNCVEKINSEIEKLKQKNMELEKRRWIISYDWEYVSN